MELREGKNIMLPPELENCVEIRFEIFDLLKNKKLSVRQAVSLLEYTKQEILRASMNENL